MTSTLSKSNTSQAVRDLNPGVFDNDGAVSITPRQTLAQRLVEQEKILPTKQDIKNENELQNQCESWLRLNGYLRRSLEDLKHAEPGAKYFVHLHKTKRNPILLDLLILGPTGRYIEIELKTVDGAVSPEQAMIIQNSNHSILVRDFEAFRAAVLIWEAAENNKKQ